MKTKEELLELIGQKNYKPQTYQELLQTFNYSGKDTGALLRHLDELEEEGSLFKTKKGKYVLPIQFGYIAGTLSKHKRGFGFVIPSIPGDGDLFISNKDLAGAMHGDKVMAHLSDNPDNSRNREGEIVKVLKRASDEIVGTLETVKNYGFVVPDDPKISEDIYVSDNNFNMAQAGDKVVVKITHWPQKNQKAEGKITEIIGKKDEAGNDIKALIRQHNLPSSFTSKVLSEAQKADQLINEDEHAGRRDLRQKKIITIDGSDAKDLDDAVCVEKLENGNYRLGVHIADVSHYIREGSELDKEAFKRGCSVYLIDQVIPMLPENISNGICSLKPHSDRLTLSVEIVIDTLGQVVTFTVFESIIHTVERMVYSDVSDILEKQDEKLIQRYSAIHQELLLMEELAMILRNSRTSRGSIDFDIDESYIILNDEGIPMSVEAAERRLGNRIIEEFMLKANEVIAEHFFWMDIPFVYRVHDKPSQEKMEEFKSFIATFGYTLKGNTASIHTKSLNEIIQLSTGKPEEHIISTVMLRSMRKAVYDTECSGHFGLGVKYYCHFTSPIRRYPDLIIHRIIKEAINELPNEKRRAALKTKTEAAALNSSEKERVSEEVEREVEKLKKAEYMTYHTGEEFDGLISGVVQSGFFVELSNTVEGMVRADLLKDDYYRYEPEKYRLIGDRTRKVYAIGDKVSIKVLQADVKNREIDFDLV